MCKAKPGRRCPTHRKAAVEAQRRTILSLKKKLDAAEPGSTERAALERQINDEARELIMRRVEYDSTEEQRTALQHDLATRLAADPKDPQITDLANRLIQARLFENYRRDQVKAMPPVPNDPALRELHTELGEQRFDMARARVRMDINGGDLAEWEHWSQRHFQAAEAANLTAAKLEAGVKAGSVTGYKDLPTEWERHKLRKKIAEDGSFHTPAAPQSLEDVLQEHADRGEGYEPIPDDLAAAAHPPYPEKTPPQPTEQSPAPSKNGADPSAPGRPAPTARERRAQNSRRSSRKRGVRSMMREVRSLKQDLSPDQIERLIGTQDMEIGLSSKDADGAPPDPTGLLMLFELLQPK